ncbi:MAG: hypothetical protein PHC51_08465 [bacterium]|nr:hypothetical protein [bacterium]
MNTVPAIRINLLRVVIAGILLVSAQGTDAEAENRNPKNRRGFSQLGFDAHSPISAEPPAETKQPAGPVLDADAIQAMVEKAYSGTITKIPEFIAPSLTGVIADQSNPGRISAMSRWPKTIGGTCESTPQQPALCKKIQSLQEVLLKFTGNDGFFSSYCQQECPSGKAVIVEIKADSEDTTLTRREQAGLCNFEISSRDILNWKVIHASEIECICLPEECKTQIITQPSNNK